MDPLNLILLIVVVLVGMKLRSVLGFRNDDEKPSSRADAYRLNREAFENKPAAKNGKTIGKDTGEEANQEASPAPEGLQEAAIPIEGSPAAEAPSDTLSDTSPKMPAEALEVGAEEDMGRGLAYLRRVQPDFDEAGFVDGAARAYEMILTAYADGDLSGVQAFLGADVAAGFDAAIDDRRAQGQQLVTRILRLDRPILDDARFENDKVQLDVRFRAELISFTAGLDDTIDEAALPSPNSALDVWTFERAQNAADPSWALIATESA